MSSGCSGGVYVQGGRVQMSLVVPNEIFFAHICELLDQGKDVSFVVKGGSMRPFIEGGKDSVTLRKEGFACGDAVLARLSGGNYVLHRVESIDGDRVTLKGDGNLTGRERCLVSDVKGKVISISRKDGRKVVDVSDARYKRSVRRWVRSPYIFRRIVLAIYRRIRI